MNIDRKLTKYWEIIYHNIKKKTSPWSKPNMIFFKDLNLFNWKSIKLIQHIKGIKAKIT